MFRKLIVFALMLAVLFGATMQPSYAQDSDQGETETYTLKEVAKSIRELPDSYKNFNFLVKGDAGDHVR